MELTKKEIQIATEVLDAVNADLEFDKRCLLRGKVGAYCDDGNIIVTLDKAEYKTFKMVLDKFYKAYKA